MNRKRIAIFGLFLIALVLLCISGVLISQGLVPNGNVQTAAMVPYPPTGRLSPTMSPPTLAELEAAANTRGLTIVPVGVPGPPTQTDMFAWCLAVTGGRPAYPSYSAKEGEWLCYLQQEATPS
jgi:hypothetical protein